MHRGHFVAKRKAKGTTFKRNGNGRALGPPVCMWCKADYPKDHPVRSNTWYRGVLGTRATLCSDECRDLWDADNLSQVAAMMGGEE